MKKKTMTLVSSVAAIAVCSSVMVGSTYALFTSEDKVNITVTSGNVDVHSSVSVVETKSFDDVQTVGQWANGGTATVVDGTVTLDKITPGDSVKLDVKVANNSNVNAKYRISYVVESGYALASGLNVILGDTDVGNYKTYSTAWSDLTEDVTLSVVIELPNHEGDTDNVYKNLTSKIAITAEAVQGNVALGSGEAEHTDLPDNSALLTAAAEGNAVVLTEDVSVAEVFANSDGKYIVLTEDTVLPTNMSNLNNVTVDANGYTILGSAFRNIKGTDVSVKNAVFENGKSGSWGTYSEGVSYYNCTFNGHSPYTSRGNMVVDGCTFNDTSLQFCPNEGDKVLPDSIVITNNVFNINNTNANVHAIVFGGGEVQEWENETKEYKHSKQIVIENNTFNPVYKEKSYVAYFVYTDSALNSVRTFANNIFNGVAPRYSVNSIENQFNIAPAKITVDFKDAEYAKSILCADCCNGITSTPHSEHSIHNQLEIDENGVATVKAAGAWIGDVSTDWCNRYEVNFDLDVSAFEDGDYIVFNIGEQAEWFGILYGVTKIDGKLYFGQSLTAGISANSTSKVEVGNTVAVKAVAYVNDSGNLVCEIYADGNLVKSITGDKANVGDVYWDIYTCLDNGRECKISNFNYVAVAK